MRAFGPVPPFFLSECINLKVVQSMANKRPPFWQREKYTPYLLLLPAILTILFVVLLPLIFSLYTSFTGYRLIRPDTLWQWVGLRNYERIFSDGDFWSAFGRTIIFLTIALNLEFLLGLGIALLIN